MLREIATETTEFTDPLDPRHLWSSTLALLARDVRELADSELSEVLDRAASGTNGQPGLRDLFEAVKAAEELPWSELLAPLDFRSANEPPEGTGPAFPFVIDEDLQAPKAVSDWVRLMGGFLLQYNDDLWPRGSWPWTVLRDATLLAAGESHWAASNVLRLSQSDEMGPLGSLLAAQALSRFDPRLAMPLAERGGACVTLEAVGHDLQILLRGDKAGPQFLRAALARIPALKADDVRILLRVFGTSGLPVVTDAVTALGGSPDLPMDEALRPVLAQHWEKELRPRFQTAFAQLWLTGYQAASMGVEPARAAQVAGWLREAAEQGYAPAQFLFGRLHLPGLGVPADPRIAALWMARAADQHYPHATCELGRLYKSLGGLENLATAAAWFRRGVEEGCPTAKYGLATL
ncbi:MAG: sel1 repeat family protein, partial [Verrucomicrobiae bacterium]|nr:sel1 repeat family protein [Verrucomicrobiae bacterium]